jgi:hypothetical protein
MSRRQGPRIDKSVLTIGIQAHGRIDKTSPDLMLREPERTVDHAYRQSARGRPCDVWGCTADPDTVVGAHLRLTLPEFPGAGARKPHDGLIAFLCYGHHQLLDRREPTTLDGYEELKNRLIVGLLMQRHRAFQAAQQRGEKP